jgi:SAM-dependent methyltransferase
VTEYERWEARYATPDYAFGKEPNYFLRSCKSLLPPSGRALAVADGEGRNGVWLAEQGLDVVSIDFSSSAQRKAKALAAERHVKVAFELVDVHNWNYPEADFDVVVEIFTQFSSPAERALKPRCERPVRVKVPALNLTPHTSDSLYSVWKSIPSRGSHSGDEKIA